MASGKKRPAWCGVYPARFVFGNGFPGVYRALIIGTVTHRKDYYTAAALVFPAILLLCVYFSVYYRHGYEAVFDFVTGHERIVIDASLQGCEQLLRRAVGYLPHIVKIDRAIFVERRGQGFFGRAYVGMRCV